MKGAAAADEVVQDALVGASLCCEAGLPPFLFEAVEKIEIASGSDQLLSSAADFFFRLHEPRFQILTVLLLCLQRVPSLAPLGGGKAAFAKLLRDVRQFSYGDCVMRCSVIPVTQRDSEVVLRALFQRCAQIENRFEGKATRLHAATRSRLSKLAGRLHCSSMFCRINSCSSGCFSIARSIRGLLPFAYAPMVIRSSFFR